MSVPKNMPAHHALFGLTPSWASPVELLQKPSPPSPNQVSDAAALRSDTNAGAVKTRRTDGWMDGGVQHTGARTRSRSWEAETWFSCVHSRQEFDLASVAWSSDKTNRTPSISCKAAWQQPERDSAGKRMLRNDKRFFFTAHKVSKRSDGE